MIIYLVQHGLSYEKEIDPERPLTPQGREEIVKIAQWALKSGIKVADIYHSGKLRARQTAELFAETLNTEPPHPISGIDPLDDVQAFSKDFIWKNRSMIVGHMPFLSRLAAYCLTGQTEPAIVEFQNAGIVCLERIEEKNWRLKWSIMPTLN